ANFEFSARVVVNGLACRVHHLALYMTSPDASIKFSFSGRRTGLPDGLSTSRDLAWPTCIRVLGFRTGPAKQKNNFMWALTLWSSLRIRRNCRVSAAMGRRA